MFYLIILISYIFRAITQLHDLTTSYQTNDGNLDNGDEIWLNLEAVDINVLMRHGKATER